MTELPKSGEIWTIAGSMVRVAHVIDDRVTCTQIVDAGQPLAAIASMGVNGLVIMDAIRRRVVAVLSASRTMTGESILGEVGAMLGHAPQLTCHGEHASFRVLLEASALRNRRSGCFTFWGLSAKRGPRSFSP